MANLNNTNNLRNEGGGVAAADIIRSPITEAELRTKDVISPDDVLRLNCITEGELSPNE